MSYCLNIDDILECHISHFLETLSQNSYLLPQKLKFKCQVLTLKNFSRFINQFIGFMRNYGHERPNLGILTTIWKLGTQNSRAQNSNSTKKYSIHRIHAEI